MRRKIKIRVTSLTIAILFVFQSKTGWSFEWREKEKKKRIRGIISDTICVCISFVFHWSQANLLHKRNRLTFVQVGRSNHNLIRYLWRYYKWKRTGCFYWPTFIHTIISFSFFRAYNKSTECKINIVTGFGHDNVSRVFPTDPFFFFFSFFCCFTLFCFSYRS